MSYRYYGILRPLSIGCFPQPKGNKILNINNFDSREYVEAIDRQALGYIEYESPLTFHDVQSYELIAVKSEKLHLKYIGKDSWGRYVYRDENGNLWKHLNCCAPREVCIEIGDMLYASSNNSLDGEPDYPMKPHISPEFI